MTIMVKMFMLVINKIEKTCVFITRQTARRKIFDLEEKRLKIQG